MNMASGLRRKSAPIPLEEWGEIGTERGGEGPEVVGNRVAIVRGLAAGERVITTGASMLTDGETVEMLPTEES